MRQEYVELIRLVSTVFAVLVGAYLGARLTLKNTLRTLEVQNKQKADELALERRTKEQEQLNLWFEDYAINKCLDPLITEILFIKLLIDQAVIEDETKVKQERSIPPMTIDACARFFTLTGVLNLPILLNVGRSASSMKIQSLQHKELVPYLNEILFHLIMLKRLMLSIELKSKTDIHKVCASELVKTQAESVEKCIYKMFKLPEERWGTNKLGDLLKLVADVDSHLDQITK